MLATLTPTSLNKRSDAVPSGEAPTELMVNQRYYQKVRIGIMYVIVSLVSDT